MRTICTIALLALMGCGDGVPEGADTFAEGRTAYADEPSAQEPAEPDAQPIEIEIRLQGSGDLSGLQPECELEGATGSFTGLMQGEGDIGSDGVYSAALVSSEGTFTTPSGSCAIPDLTIGLVTNVVVVGMIEATQQNCETYCSSKARSESATSCEGDADEASCRSDFEAEYTGSCETTCGEPTTHRIVAETSLGADALAAVNADIASLGATALGTVEADLTFDHLEDSSGGTVDEAPE